MVSYDFSSFNWIAIVVAVVASFLVGGIVYGAVFGNTWRTLHKYTDEDLQRMAKSQARTFAIFIIMDLVAAMVIAMFLGKASEPSAVVGMQFAFFAWLGFGLVDTAKQNAAHRKPIPAFVLDTLHHLASLLVMGAIIGGWR